MLPVKRLILVLIVLMGLPAVAMANAGTPLVWTMGLHLLFGNTALGILEGGLLIYWFRLPMLRTIPLMIVANYFSAWVGLIGVTKVSYFMETPVSHDLNNIYQVLGLLVFLAYLVTLVLEWPFVWAALGKVTSRFRSSILATLAVQTLSYLLLIAIYSQSVDISFLEQTTQVAAEDLELSPKVRLYYVAPDNDRGNSTGKSAVYTRLLSGGPVEKLMELEHGEFPPELQLRPVKDRPGFYEIHVFLSSWTSSEDQGIALPVQVAAEDCPVNYDGAVDELRHQTYRGIASLSSAAHSPWKVTLNNGFPLGFGGENRETGQPLNLMIDLPFPYVAFKDATLLPEEQIVFSLEPQGISVLDLQTMRFAKLLDGHSVLAVLDLSESEPVQP